jgi:hypothetical protein
LFYGEASANFAKVEDDGKPEVDRLLQGVEAWIVAISNSNIWNVARVFRGLEVAC